MSESTVSPLLAMAALLAVAVSAVIAVGVMAPAASGLRAAIDRFALAGSFLVAGVATAASLYYSEVVGFIPCEFCWYQRIAMYPLAVVLLVAVMTSDRRVTRYVVTIAAIGLAISLYHYQLQLFPEQSTMCSLGVPCTMRYVNEFDFVTIPFMAGSGFLSVLLLQFAAWRAHRIESALEGTDSTAAAAV